MSDRCYTKKWNDWYLTFLCVCFFCCFCCLLCSWSTMLMVLWRMTKVDSPTSVSQKVSLVYRRVDVYLMSSLLSLSLPLPPSVGVGKEQVEIAEQLRELLKAAAENPPQRSRSKQVSSLVARPSPSHSPTPPTVTPSHKARNPALHPCSSPTPERRSPVPREAGKSLYYSESSRHRGSGNMTY